MERLTLAMTDRLVARGVATEEDMSFSLRNVSFSSKCCFRQRLTI